MNSVSKAIFPRQIDNTYRGHPLGIWMFSLIVLLKLIIGTNSTFNTHTVATGDGIAVDSFAAGAAEMVIAMFAQLGFGHLLLGILGLIVLIRYRAMIPLILLLFAADFLGRKAVALLHPTHSSSSVGFYINMALLAITLIGLALSLITKRPAGERASGGA